MSKMAKEEWKRLQAIALDHHSQYSEVSHDFISGKISELNP